MVHLRNKTRSSQWLDDPDGGRRSVEAGALAKVSAQSAESLLRAAPTKWELATAIALPPPAEEPQA